MTVRRINLADARLRRLARDLRMALEEQQPPRQIVAHYLPASVVEPTFDDEEPPRPGIAEVTVRVGSAREAQEVASLMKTSDNTIVIQYGVKRA